MTPIYHHFAKHYHDGPYTLYAEKIAHETFPHFLSLLDFKPLTLLDLACGTGIFAVAMAKNDMRVTGLDQSEHQLNIARKEARAANVEIEWLRASMSDFMPVREVDCVTCWYDSLNYLIKIEELSQTFSNAFLALRPGGYFCFDMNTIYGLAVQWQRFPYFIQQETPDYLEVVENSYNYEVGLAQMRIIMLERNNKTWARHEEIHQERGYAIDDILLLLDHAGFTVKHLTGDPRLMTPLGDRDGRVWIIAQKPA